MPEEKKHDVVSQHKPDEAPAQAPKHDEGRHERVKELVTRVHPSARDVEVKAVHEVASNLYVARFSYHPAAGVKSEGAALVFDNGEENAFFLSH